VKNCLVSGRYLESKHNEDHAAISIALLSFIRELGFSPQPVWNETFGKQPLIFDRQALDLLVLSGGETIGTQASRDEFELNLLQEAERARIPVLGICRGMQVMMSTQRVELEELDAHSGTRHHITGEFSGEVNSFHNFGVKIDPVGFEAIAHAEDHSVEAIRHKSNPWLGIMWHPEREKNVNKDHAAKILNILGFL